VKLFRPWLCASLLFAACTTGAVSEEPIKVAGVTLRVREEEKRTTIDFDGPAGRGSVPLLLEPPCAVVRNHRGEPQVHTYKDAGNATVIIFVGRLAEVLLPDGKTRQLRGTQSQAILIRDGRATASKRVVSDGRWSPTQGIDEKEFWLFSHPPKGR
jgi:hypothetical protein